MLTAVMLLLCLAQLGPILVLLPATVWMYWSGDNLWGTLLLVCGSLQAGTLLFTRVAQGVELLLQLGDAGLRGLFERIGGRAMSSLHRLGGAAASEPEAGDGAGHQPDHEECD